MLTEVSSFTTVSFNDMMRMYCRKLAGYGDGSSGQMVKLIVLQDRSITKCKFCSATSWLDIMVLTQ